MNSKKGFSTLSVLLVIAGIAVLAAAGYIFVQSQATDTTANNPSPSPAAQENADVRGPRPTESEEISATWQLTDAGERENIPYTNVAVTVNGKAYDMGSFAGSCSEIGESGGVDGKGLLAGELFAVQCWFAGGGDEIGVFAHEDGGFEILVGQLGEPTEGSAGFRGNFTVKHSVPL